jgi:ADP-ribose pyrophosphatase YjhB (NUDIX family)
MSRVDYYHQDDAPPANSIVVAVTVFVQDERERVLMIRRSDNALWALPGGAQDLGESLTDAAVRETKEETGLHIRVTGLVGIYSDPRHLIAYSNGEVRQEFSICFRAALAGGDIRTSGETTDVQWLSISEIDDAAIHPSMRLRIGHGIANLRDPYLG